MHVWSLSLDFYLKPLAHLALPFFLFYSSYPFLYAPEHSKYDLILRERFYFAAVCSFGAEASPANHNTSPMRTCKLDNVLLIPIFSMNWMGTKSNLAHADFFTVRGPINFAENFGVTEVKLPFSSCSVYLQEENKQRHSDHSCFVLHWGNAVLNCSQILGLVVYVCALSCLTCFQKHSIICAPLSLVQWIWDHSFQSWQSWMQFWHICEYDSIPWSFKM